MTGEGGGGRSDAESMEGDLVGGVDEVVCGWIGGARGEEGVIRQEEPDTTVATVDEWMRQGGEQRQKATAAAVGVASIYTNRCMVQTNRVKKKRRQAWPWRRVSAVVEIWIDSVSTPQCRTSMALADNVAAR